MSSTKTTNELCLKIYNVDPILERLLPQNKYIKRDDTLLLNILKNNKDIVFYIDSKKQSRVFSGWFVFDGVVYQLYIEGAEENTSEYKNLWYADWRIDSYNTTIEEATEIEMFEYWFQLEFETEYDFLTKYNMLENDLFLTRVVYDYFECDFEQAIHFVNSHEFKKCFKPELKNYNKIKEFIDSVNAGEDEFYNFLQTLTK